MRNISRQHTVKGKEHSYLFGIDRVSGMFLSMFDKDGNPLLNFTQIRPFDRRFIVSEVEKTIPAEDLALIRAQETRPVEVYFDVGVDDDYEEDKTSPVLLNHIEEAVPFECRTFGEVMDAHTHFSPGEFFEYVSYVDVESRNMVELGNDEKGIN